MWSTNPWNKARPQHREFHPLLFSYFIQKDKTLLLIVIFFLTVVNLIGDSHTNEVYIFQLWGVIEMHWLNYSAPKSLLNEILQKYHKSIHMWKIGKFCFLTWYPKIQLAILLLFGDSCWKSWYFVVDHEYFAYMWASNNNFIDYSISMWFALFCRLRLWTAGAVVGFH